MPDLTMTEARFLNIALEGRKIKKVSQRKADYKKAADTKLCRSCEFYNYNLHTCDLVDGPVEPHGSCKFWTAES